MAGARRRTWSDGDLSGAAPRAPAAARRVPEPRRGFRLLWRVSKTGGRTALMHATFRI